MIPLFRKLQSENLLKQKGILLDLGCGNSKISEPFFHHGYDAVLVDKDAEVLSEAENKLKKIKAAGFRIVNIPIEDFDFNENYDGIIMSNVLPFQKSKENIEKIMKTAFSKLNRGGFLFLTLFGNKDQWVNERADTMSFYTKEEALKIIGEEPHFISEDYGQGITLKGSKKIWHIFYLLYIKL